MEKLKILVVTPGAPCSNPSKSPELEQSAPERKLLFAAILQTPERPSKVSCRLCTAEGVGSNPIGSTVKLPANDEEIEYSGHHAEGAVQ
jgi:hypothetical protein